MPRADKIYNSLLARVVRSRGILLLFRFVSLRSPFDKLVASLGVSCCDPRSFEGDPDSGLCESEGKGEEVIFRDDGSLDARIVKGI